MTNHIKTTDRRTVLRSIAAGTTTLAGLGAAGTAAADHFQPGECVKLIYDVQSWSSCYKTSYGPLIERGRGGVFSTCEDNSLVHFVPDSPDQEDGWVDESYLERC